MSNLKSLANSNVGLFLCLSSIFIVYPHLVGSTIATTLLDLIFSALIILSLCRRSQLPTPIRIVYIITGAAATISTWFNNPAGPIELMVPALYALFFGMSVFIHFHGLINEPDVDADTLLGAACTYILTGMFFATLNAVFLKLDPTCISIPDDGGEPMYHLIYFSFITLTTVGYGDVLPMSNATRMLAAYESIIGQIFVAVIVGLLVGKHLAHGGRPRQSQE